MSEPSAISDSLREQIEAQTGAAVTEATRPDTGLTAAERFVVTLDDGRRLFAKAAVDEATERWLRVDHLIMTTVREDFVPEVLCWLEPEDRHPILMIEDLSGAHWPADQWPVLWHDGQMDRLLTTMERLAQIEAPEGIDPMPDAARASRWGDIGADLEPFLRLGLCSESWLQSHLAALSAAEAATPFDGDRLIHDDIRSDNVCFVGERVVLVDWSQAMRGHADYDRAQTLPYLRLEGGPDPCEIMPEGGSWAARAAGNWAQRALGQQGPEWLIKVFLRLCAINLTWASSSLGLPAPDGIPWEQIE